MSKPIKVALIGNPNTGKTSVFNQLTGLNQKVGNYPGITVEKKEGACKLADGKKAKIFDLPGTYSLNAGSLDEGVVVDLLLNEEDADRPDVAVVIADVENLKRNLLLFTQVKDLKLPVVLAINMSDRMPLKGISIDVPQLEKTLDTKIALVSTRKNQGLDDLKALIADHESLSAAPNLSAGTFVPPFVDALQQQLPDEDPYRLWLALVQHTNDLPLTKGELAAMDTLGEPSKTALKKHQHKETVKRYQFINAALKDSYMVDKQKATGIDALLDRILVHKVFGYLIFLAILLLIFQAIFTWSSYPSDLIDAWFAALGEWTKNSLPEGMLTDLLAEGIIAGIGGIVVFVPQIAFLFFFIALLEESGYMSRVVFLMDRLMRPFGLSGKSVVPLISGTACAIPAVMATRTIEDWKERLITILVVPFTTCSARLPIYLILIALVIPKGSFLGIGYQALALFLLYVIGFAMALFSAMLLNKLLKTRGKSFFMAEMPTYRMPLPKNVGHTVIEKTKSFVLGAGKIILAISIVLWFLGSNGISEEFKNAEIIVSKRIEQEGLADYSKNYIEKKLSTYPQSEAVKAGGSLQSVNDALLESAKAQEIAGFQLEHSFMGHMGKAIEPLVKPLGYDWKIGIALITSFAAREVFVATLATIYSVGSDEQGTIKNRMAAELGATGKPLFNLATGTSLLLFYAFAMQCMSTLAIVKRETNSWKWPLLQLVFMSVLAYLVAFMAYQMLSM